MPQPWAQHMLALTPLKTPLSAANLSIGIYHCPSQMHLGMLNREDAKRDVGMGAHRGGEGGPPSPLGRGGDGGRPRGGRYSCLKDIEPALLQVLLPLFLPPRHHCLLPLCPWLVCLRAKPFCLSEYRQTFTFRRRCSLNCLERSPYSQKTPLIVPREMHVKFKRGTCPATQDMMAVQALHAIIQHFEEYLD